MKIEVRVMKFLDGLSDEYGLIINQLIGRVPLLIRRMHMVVSVGRKLKIKYGLMVLSNRQALLNDAIQQVKPEKKKYQRL